MAGKLCAQKMETTTKPQRYSDGDNHYILNSPTHGRRVAMSCDNVHMFVAELWSRTSVAALAMELCLLTLTRPTELLKAEWCEFDKAIRTIPTARMKAGRATAFH